MVCVRETLHSSDWAYYLNNWKSGNETFSEALQECEILEVETKVEKPSHEGSGSATIDETDSCPDC